MTRLSPIAQNSVLKILIAAMLVFGLPHVGLSQTRPILRSGAQGAEVSELQAALKLLGYFDGTVDGVFGNGTASAVSRFQQVAGLQPDGVVGTATWNRLFPTAETPQSGTTQSGTTQSETTTPATSRPNRLTPAPVSTLPILRRGMRGDAVRGLQERLNAIGVYSGEVDGVFGAGTEEAVKTAQRRAQLEPDGIVGGATWSAILRSR